MMDSEVPFDTSSPAVRDYLALIRLQVLTPLSLLVNIATFVVCAGVISPSLSEISDDHRTTLTPKPWMIAMYGVAIWVTQIGYCIMLVLARKSETKQALIHGSGQWIVWANWSTAAWAVAFVLQWFLTATVLLGISLLLLLFSNIALITIYPPTGSRPLDIALIHAPLRLFLILPMMVLFGDTLFIAMGHWWDRGHPQHYAHHQWAGFGVVLGTNLLGLLIVVFRRDIVWCVAATWLSAAIFTARPKPFPVYITALTFAIVHPLALVASALVLRLRHPRVLEATKPSDRESQVPDGEREPLLGPQGSSSQPGAHPASSGPREVDAVDVWG